MVGMWDDRQGYLEQIKYSNKLILEFLDELFKNKDPDSFIVIIQGDHGAKFSRNNDEGDDVFYKRQLGILNAYYLPNKESRKKLYEKISPINSFRLIFNEFLEGNFPLHEDKHFYSDFLEQFDYKEVGSILYKNGNNN